MGEKENKKKKKERPEKRAALVSFPCIYVQYRGEIRIIFDQITN